MDFAAKLEQLKAEQALIVAQIQPALNEIARLTGQIQVYTELQQQAEAEAEKAKADAGTES